jgi:type VI secretion system secreted protein VgrG
MTQQAVFAIASDALPPSTRAIAFHGMEGISQLFEFTIHVMVPRDADEVDLEAAMGQPISLKMLYEDGTPRNTFHGIIAAIKLANELPDDVEYEVTMVPRLWQLQLSEHSHIYVNRTLPEILEATLKRGGLSPSDYELRLSGRYRPLEHVCQYKESYFSFLSRWMEREGIYYYFDHEGPQDKVILMDSRATQAPFSGDPVRFYATGTADTSTLEALHTWTARLQRMPASVRFHDYNYLTPTVLVSGSAPAQPNGTGEIVRFGDNHLNANDARRFARLRAEEILTREMVYHGTGRSYAIRSGYTFELEEHPRAEFNQEYLAVSVIHRGNNASTEASFRARVGADEAVYQVEVGAIRASVQYRPPRVTPTPRIDGFELATVDGEITSDYAQIDAHGRYFVRFNFDESELPDGQASTRVRMMQPHGGAIEGFHFPLRKHTEVLVAFLGGDPDRPVIIGVVPNADRPSPVTSNNHTQNVIQTGGRNRIEIEDLDGSQYIKLKTPTANTMIHMGKPHNPTHYLQVETDENCLLKVAKEWDVEISGWLKETVKGYVKETYLDTMTTEVTGKVTERYKDEQDTDVACNQLLKVGGEQLVFVKGPASHEYDSTLQTSVKGTATHIYQDMLDMSVNSLTKQQLKGGHDLKVTGNQMIEVSGTRTDVVKGAKTETALSAESKWVVGNYVIAKASAAVDISASAKLTLSASASLELKVSLAVSLALSIALNVKASIELNINMMKIESTLTDIKDRKIKISSEGAVDLTLAIGVKLEQAGFHIVL